MKPIVRSTILVTALAAVLTLAGCIDTATTVTVKPDGSGTIERTIVLSNQLVELMVGMGMGGDAATVQAQMLDEDELRSTESLGSGVTFVSLDKMTTEKGAGYRATYKFTDVTKIRVDQSPSGSVNLPQSPNPENEPAGPELVTFAFTKGNPATLTIKTPKAAAQTAQPASPAPAEGAEDAMAMMGMFKDLYADMRVVLNIVVQGTITKTNATHVSGSTVTLMDMDFGKLFEDETIFQKLAAANTQSLAETQALLKGVPGVKLEPQETVTISFR